MKSNLQRHIDNPSEFIEKALMWAKNFEFSQLLNTAAPSHHAVTPDKYRFILALGIHKLHTAHYAGNAFAALKSLYNTPNWYFGVMAYDLKNEVEKLRSDNPDHLSFPELYFVQPKMVLYCYYGEHTLHLEGMGNTDELAALYNDIINQPKPCKQKLPKVTFAARDDKASYVHKIENIKKAIQSGDIYELNYCQEFYTHEKIDGTNTYLQLNRVSPTPFGAYISTPQHAIMCASPERFITKRGKKLYSQPIKGTIKRGTSIELDEQMKVELHSSEKDRAENVMIVDLVRNDLSHYAAKGSVKVDELFGIYSFPQVHQMISTVSCKLKDSAHPIDSLRAAFPMGSMTGAPKLKSMELIEAFEEAKRGPYSGAIGYIAPDGDFDFNVVIRSMFYNKLNHYLSFSVGGAITILSEPEAEYDECLLKAEAMLKTFSHD
jgi:para-aminobenzoate synthetase component 1